MNGDVHVRAHELISESMLGTLPASDDRWLREHLATCGECSARQNRMATALDSLKATPVMAPPVLVARTRAVVRAHSRELEESSTRLRLVVISCTLAIAWTALALPVLWTAYTWITGASGLTASGLTWIVAMAWLWLMPALFGSAVLLSNRNAHQPAFTAVQKGWARE